MKKIISLILFVAALSWTWNMIYSSEGIGFETHTGIQIKLADLIKETLMTKKPQAQDLNIQRLWTETLTENKIRAVFSFTFTDTTESGETLEQTIEGEAILHRELSESSDVDQWAIQSIKTTNDFVTFTEGSLLTPEPEATEETSSPMNSESTGTEAESNSSENTNH